MPYAFTNGIRLSYRRSGSGERVLLIMGTGAGGSIWRLHQVPALNEAGYETITFANRGVPPSDVPPGDYSLTDMVADTAGLIETLDAGPCRIVATSMGALIAAQLAVDRPDLVTACVLIALRARADATRRALLAGHRALSPHGIRLPAAYDAPTSVLQMFSPRTLNDETAALAWLRNYELSAAHRVLASGQLAIDFISDRRSMLQAVPVPCRVIAFSDDLICPPYLCTEVADAIPDCDYVEISSCGHVGYLERPCEVNSAIIEFLDKTRQ